MDLDAPSLLASFAIGSVGFVLFVYGKRQSRIPQMAVGFVAMVYPYFVPGVLPMVAVALVLFGLLGVALRLGW